MSHLWTENQWYSFICGFQAGMKLRNLTLPNIDNNVTLFPLGVAGSGQIGLAMPNLVYDGVNNSGVIPVFVHDVDIPYGAFSVNISWDPTVLRFDGVTAGDFGSIGTYETASDIRYTYNNGVFKARGIKTEASNFTEPIILFYLNVTIISTPSSDIVLKFNNRSNTDLDYTTLMAWVIDQGTTEPFTYFITPISNINGKILVTDTDDSSSAIGDDNSVGAPGSPTGIYIGTAFTPPGKVGVVPIYANSNVRDNFPYNKVSLSVEVDDPDGVITYIGVVGAGGFSVSVSTSILPSGNLRLNIVATRTEQLIDSVTFCYIQYSTSAEQTSYKIPLRYLSGSLSNGGGV